MKKANNTRYDVRLAVAKSATYRHPLLAIIKMTELKSRHTILTCFLILFIGLVVTQSMRGQKIELDMDLLDSLLYEDNYSIEMPREIAYNLRSVYRFNQIKSNLGQTDMLKVFKEGIGYYAMYRGQRINLDSSQIKREGLLSISRIKGHGWGETFFSETSQSDTTCTRISVSNSGRFSKDPLIRIEKYCRGIICGEYREQTVSGKVVAYGRYILRDSIYQDTLIAIDPDTYEEQIEIVNRMSVGIKCGKWVRMNLDGELMEVNCK